MWTLGGMGMAGERIVGTTNFAILALKNELSSESKVKEGTD